MPRPPGVIGTSAMICAAAYASSTNEAGVTACGTEGTQQTQVVESETTTDQQHGTAPVPSEHRSDLVSLAEQPLVQAGDLVVAPKGLVPEPLQGSPDDPQGLVRCKDDDPTYDQEYESHQPQESGMDQSWIYRRPTGERREGEERQRKEVTYAEERGGCQTASGFVRIDPGGSQHPELDASTRRIPARHHRGDDVADEPGRDHRKPSTGPQDQALKPEVAGERGPSATTAPASQTGLSVESSGQAPTTRLRLGNTT
jgi:hypothetical protein